MGQSVRQPVLDTPPKITLGITEACPYRCRHCYGACDTLPKPRELDAAQWIALVRDLARQGVIQAYIEGGEPLYKPGFLDILRTATPLMMTLMRTHGWSLTRDMARQLADAGLGRGLVDIMGSDAATHEWFTMDRGSFASACGAVRNLVAADIPTDMLVILTRQNAAQLPAIARLAADLGAQRLGVLRLYPLGRARDAWSEIALGLSDQMAALAALDPPPCLDIMQSWHPYDHNCCWQAAAINAFGRAIGCMYLRDYVDFGDARQTPYVDIYRTDPLYRALRSGDVEESCADCTATQGSRGGCRSAAYAFRGRWTAPDPFDVTLNHGMDLTLLPPARKRHAGFDTHAADKLAGADPQ
jgi:radical SAM protein with 4Fe4S-binding SPASM domain